MRVLQLLVITLALAFAKVARADGMVFPAANTPQQLLEEAPSRIPFQRAVIKFDGKQQIMLIESTINGPAGSYGWVVPLPKRPSYVKSVKPEYIEGTFRSIKPPVQPLPKENLQLLAIGAIFATTLFLTAGLRYRKFEAPVRVMCFVGEVCAVGLLYYFGMNGVPMPSGSMADKAENMAAAKAMDMSRNLQVESYGTVGAYEVSVLKGTSAEPVMEWLEKHQIQVPEKSRKVIDAYAKEGWVFMAAEIRKNEDRALPPHPLKAVFDTDKPIYPMRLTGTQDGPLHLELAVVGYTKATVEGMDEWSCKNDQLLVYVPRGRDENDLYTEWENDLYAMAKNGAVVTYLRGDFEPEEMRKDFKIEWQPYERYIAEVYDEKQAIERAKALALLWLPCLAGLFGLVGIFWPLRAQQVAIAGVALALLASGGVGVGWLRSVKTVETSSSETDQPQPGGYYVPPQRDGRYYTPPIHSYK